MLPWRDIGLVAIIGFVFGWLLIPIFANLGIVVPGGFVFFLPALFVLFAVAALFAAWLLAKLFPPIFQFAKFAAVGALNSSVDFGVLNILILATGIAAGLPFVGFKGVSVVVAIVNSYLWNKFWVFRGGREARAAAEFTKFFGVSVIGVGVNVGVAHLLVNVVGSPGGINPKIWANVGAGVSVLATLFWNFFGYKFFVFKKFEELGT